MFALIRIATAAALLMLAGCQSPPPMRSELKHMAVDGASLAYVDDGQGTPVVFVHGSLGDYRSWDRQRAIVGKQYRVIAYSQRYFGTEPWSANWPKLGVPVHSQDLAAFIQGLGVGPVHLVSWSSSGQTVLQVALAHPELVRSAFVFEPSESTFVTDPGDLKTIGEERKAFGPAADAVQAGDNDKAARLVLDVVAGRTNAIDAWPATVQAIVMDNSRTLPKEFMDSDPPPKIDCAQLGQARPHIAFVRGDATRPRFRIIADTAARCLPAAKLIIVPGAGHLWPGDDPQAFSRTLLDFLERG